MRKFLIAFVILASLGLIAPNAHANPSIAVAAFTVAAELIPAALPLQSNAVNIGFGGVTAVFPVSINFTLTNATWKTSSVLSICDVLGTQYGTGTASATANATVTVALGTAQVLAPGSTYILQPAACVAGSVAINTIEINAATPTGSSVTLTMSNTASPSDSNIFATNTVINIVTQFTATLKNIASGVINFGGIGFLSDPTASLLIDSNDAISQKVAITGPGTTLLCTATLGALDSLQFTLVGNISGVLSVNFAGTEYAVSTASPTFTVPGTGFKICSLGNALLQTPNALTIDAGNGTTTGTSTTVALVPGTITATGILNGGTDVAVGFSETLVPAATSMFTFILNYSSFQVPYLSTNPQVITACVVNNAANVLGFNPSPASVTLSTLSTDTGGAAVLQQNVALGTIPISTTALITFSGSTVQMGNGAVVPITIPAGARYEGLVNVNNNYPNVTMNCIQTDPVAGPKRLVPVLIPESINRRFEPSW